MGGSLPQLIMDLDGAQTEQLIGVLRTQGRALEPR
jgi:hypothetical protein